MNSLIEQVEKAQRKAKVTQVTSGDTVKVHQKISEAGKQRVQIFEGVVIGTRRLNSLTASLTVRRIASGVGVEKTFLLHSPLISQIEVIKRSRVKRNRLNYMKNRSGKAARLSGVEFDRGAVNVAEEMPQDEKESAESEADIPDEPENGLKIPSDGEASSDKEENAQKEEPVVKADQASEKEAEIAIDDENAKQDKKDAAAE